ncbi:hypothetical protein [Streptomyces sp. NPDC005805]|uniref:hypothetical protein n=1 Tax=Streptomyces sp. NPDC005805 TaxID=3157068 RepID=UPI0033DF4690
MGQEADRAEQLRAIEEAPVLARPAGIRERLIGPLSAAALFAVAVTAAANRIPLLVGCLALAVLFGIVLGWRWFHLGAPGRRPHTKVEESVSLLAVVTSAFPGAKLLWDNPAPLPDALAAATVPAAALLAYLVLRWRR